MPLLSSSAIASIRAGLSITLTHTYTRTPMVAGSEDDWGETDPVPGTPVVGVSCRYETIQRAIRDAGGVTLVNLPTLAVAATDPIKAGDAVSNIVGSDGVVIAAGPFRVERLLDDSAGLGAALLSVYELRGTQVND